MGRRPPECVRYFDSGERVVEDAWALLGWDVDGTGEMIC